MSKQIRFTLLVTLILMSFVLAACGAEEAAPVVEEPVVEDAAEEVEVVEDEMETEGAQEANTIVDVAIADGNFSTLLAAAQAAGLAETLAGEGPFTLFAPTDDAFASLPEGTVEALLEDPEGALTDVLLYHVVEGEVPAEQVVGMDSVTSLAGEEIVVSVEDGNVILNGTVMVTMTDIQASNGVIHVIDGVLLPPSMESAETPQSIAEIAAADPNFSTLVAALDAAGLVDTLAGEGEFTVFAPTNDAFAALPEGTLDALLAEPGGQLTDILLYHVADGVVPAEQVTMMDTVSTLLGEEITVSVEDGSVILNDSVMVTATDIEASNGIIHVVDGVLLPPTEQEAAQPSITEIAAADENFSTLVAALEAAGLAETLAGEGEFTVFAPTNDAFAALPEGTVETLLEDPQGQLTDILLYHVVEGVVPAEQVVTLESATTLLGEEIAIVVEDGNVVLNESVNVITTDIEANNGIIHVIDGVLLPPTAAEEEAAELPTIAEIAAGDENFSTLVAALEAAGLVDTLAGEEEYTVFAPTNDAFAALPEGTLDALLAEPEGQLTDILLYHVVSGAVPAEQVVTLESATTLLGPEIMISVEDGNVILNGDVMVTATDIMAANGVVHVIDAVLLPPDESAGNMLFEQRPVYASQSGKSGWMGQGNGAYSCSPGQSG